MLCLNISDIATIIIEGVDYGCIIHNISKFEAIHLLENSVLKNHEYIKDACQRNQLFMSDYCLDLINLKNAKHLKNVSAKT